MVPAGKMKLLSSKTSQLKRSCPLCTAALSLILWMPMTARPEAPAPWALPSDPALAAEHGDEYAWRVFVAVNWPADLQTRTADRAASFGSDRPVVWESWRNAKDVYLDDGSDPGAWAPAPAAPIAPERRFETISLKDLPNAMHIVGGRMVPVVDPIADARHLTEIHMNRSAFDYVRARELYNLDGQLRLIAQARSVDFPQGAMEIKANWRPIAAHDRVRYHTLEMTLADGGTRLYGLSALHIVSKALPQWVWATFEHVDNPSLPDSEGWQLPSRDRFACAGAPACNQAPLGIGLEGTVWRYYRLRGTLTRYVNAEGGPELLANSELEAGMQGTASCITCHSRATLGVSAGEPVHLPIFDTSPTRPVEGARARRSFNGEPKAEWFDRFQSLDFVWSLTMARPKKELLQ